MSFGFLADINQTNQADICEFESNEGNDTKEERKENADEKESTPHDEGLITYALKSTTDSSKQEDTEEDRDMKDMIGEGAISG